MDVFFQWGSVKPAITKSIDINSAHEPLTRVFVLDWQLCSTPCQEEASSQITFDAWKKK